MKQKIHIKRQNNKHFKRVKMEENNETRTAHTHTASFELNYGNRNETWFISNLIKNK